MSHKGEIKNLLRAGKASAIAQYQKANGLSNQEMDRLMKEAKEEISKERNSK